MIEKDNDSEFTNGFILNVVGIIAGSMIAIILIIAGCTAHENTMKKEALVSGVSDAVVNCTFSKSISCEDKNNQLKLEEEKSINKMLMDCKIDGNIVKNYIVRVK